MSESLNCKTLDIQIADKIAVVTLNRPPVNAQNAELHPKRRSPWCMPSVPPTWWMSCHSVMLIALNKSSP